MSHCLIPDALGMLLPPSSCIPAGAVEGREGGDALGLRCEIGAAEHTKTSCGRRVGSQLRGSSPEVCGVWALSWWLLLQPVGFLNNSK